MIHHHHSLQDDGDNVPTLYDDLFDDDDNRTFVALIDTDMFKVKPLLPSCPLIQKVRLESFGTLKMCTSLDPTH